VGITPGVLLRSDNLQGLTPADVSRLIDRLGLTDVVDLRTSDERVAAGPGPLSGLAQHHELTLIPDGGWVRPDPGRVLPDRWAGGAVGAYLHYLQDKPENVLAAVRVVAGAEGAVVVHCAAGKDRTGVVVALCLSAVGVDPDLIVADYAATNERIEAVFARLAADAGYHDDVVRLGLDAHRVLPETMTGLLAVLDSEYGGATGYLTGHGLTETELDQLRARLT